MVVTKSKRPHTSSIPLERVFYLGSGKFPDYANPNNLLQQAKASGEHWAETFIRLCLETRGRGLFNWCRFSPSLEDQAELFRCANVVPGLGDAGAHVSQIMDAGWPTFMLSHYVRERGDLSIELAVRKMTSDPARILGIEDRGLLKAGLRADVTVFYPEEVAALQPRLVSDFPGGARRFIQTASGYRAIIVNGVVSLLDGELTGARPGNVLRFVS
jgi:N-acyl-D-aspartate/D-glutamate deacylase